MPTPASFLRWINEEKIQIQLASHTVGLLLLQRFQLDPAAIAKLSLKDMMECAAACVWVASHADDEDFSTWDPMSPKMRKTLISIYDIPIPQNLSKHGQWKFIRDVFF